MQFQKTRGSLDTIIFFFFFPLSHVFFMSLKQRAPVGPRATAAGEECEAVERGAADGAVAHARLPCRGQGRSGGNRAGDVDSMHCKNAVFLPLAKCA